MSSGQAHMKRYLVFFFLLYLRIAAKIQLAKIRPIIIGVAGSSGKTSVCSLIELVLSEKFRVKQSGGKNSETGIPLDILAIHMKHYRLVDWMRVLVLVPLRLLFYWEKYDYYVVEMGIDSPVEPKNMSYLLKILSPDIALVTNISLEHSQYFEPFVRENEPSRKEAVLRLTASQETLLLTSRKRTQHVIVNMDDAYIAAEKDTIQAKQIRISIEKNTKITTNNIKINEKGLSFEIIYENEVFKCHLPYLLPEYFVYSVLFAVAVGDMCEVPLSASIQSITEKFTLPPGRSSLFQGIKNTTIIDSSYNNATLPPILGMLDLLHSVARGRSLAIIGDMRELGSLSQENHEIVAQKIIQTSDRAILIGPLMQQFAAPVLEKAKCSYKSFTTFTQAKQYILNSIRPHDVILIKGSQNTLYLERVVEMLLADKKDSAKLCRRGSFWDEQRRKTA